MFAAIRSSTSWLLAVSSALSACGLRSEQAQSYPFTLRAESDPSEPLAGVQLSWAGQVVATSDAQGAAAFALRGDEGLHVALTAQCPPSTTAFERELSTTLRAYQGTGVPELLVRCTPNERELAVVARFENGAGLPIQHRLKTLAVTDSDGVAHFTLRGKPGETFELVINTASQPGLRPASPSAQLTISGHEDAQLLDRSFSLPPAKPRPRARGPVLPRRI